MDSSGGAIVCLACKAENKIGARFCRQCGAQIAASVSAYDRAKWQALVQYDPDVSAAADTLRPFGQMWVDELGASYMALNDKSYLSGIAEKVTARAVAERQRQAEIKRQQAERDAAAAERARQGELERQRSAAARQKQIDEFIALIWGTRDRKIITSAVIVALAAGLYFLVWYPAPFGVSASPTAFVDQIYVHYRTGSDFRWNPYAPPVDAEVFEPSLVDALREDIALNAGDEPGWGDANVFCECQDIVDIESRAKLDSSSWTNANVSIDIGNSGRSSVLHFLLVAHGSEWRIYDIISSSGRSFRDAVIADLGQSRLRKGHSQ